MIRRPPRSTLFPSPPLFRSLVRLPADGGAARHHSQTVAVLLGATVGRSRKNIGRDRWPELVVDVLLVAVVPRAVKRKTQDRKSTRLNSSHSQISYAVFCLKK